MLQPSAFIGIQNSRFDTPGLFSRPVRLLCRQLHQGAIDAGTASLDFASCQSDRRFGKTNS
jgi:hypothetical protein